MTISSALTLSMALTLSLQASGTPQAPARPADTAARKSGEAYYLFIQGREAEINGDAPAAIRLYQQAAQLDPTSGDILAELAALYARQNQPREAITAADSALKVAPDTVEAHWVLGNIYAAYAQTEEPVRTDVQRLAYREYVSKAIPHLEAVATARGTIVDEDLLLMLGRLYLGTSAYDKAIMVLTKVVERQPDSLDGMSMLAQAYASSGKLADATRLLEGAAAAEPSFYPILADLYERAGQWREAADTYRKASLAGADNTEIKKKWALALLNTERAGDPSKARDLLQDIVSANPKDTRALYMLSQAQRQMNDYAAAEATARKLIAIDAEGASGPFALSQIYEEQREYRKVAETLQPLVDRVLATPTPGRTIDLAPILLHLGLAYLDLQEPDRALSALERGQQLSPDNATIDAAIIEAHISAGRPDAAIEAATRAHTKYPDDTRVARLEAEALRQGGQSDKAITLLQQVERQHPDDVANYVALADALVNGNRTDEAATVLQEAHGRFPDDLTVLFETGAVCERQKRYADAEHAFRDVIARDPLYAPALNYLGFMLADRGERLNEAVEYIQRALTIDPNNPAYLDSLGWAYFKMNRLDQAEPNLRAAATARVRDSAVQDHWGDLLMKRGRVEDAVTAWRRALAGDGESIDRAAIEEKVRKATRK